MVDPRTHIDTRRGDLKHVGATDEQDLRAKVSVGLRERVQSVCKKRECGVFLCCSGERERERKRVSVRERAG